MRTVIFHSTVAPYRVSFFNELSHRLNAKICLYYRNLKDQTFDYEAIERRFDFKPDHFERRIKIGPREFYVGHIKRIRKYHPDLVITPEYNLGLWAAVLYRFISHGRYRIVTMTDDSMKMVGDCKGGRKLARDMACRLIDGLILCGDDVAGWYRERFGIDTYVLPIIQDETDYYSDKVEAQKLAKEIRDRYGLKGKRVFLYVGRIAPEKNLPYLVRSFVKQHKDHPENVLFIVGSAAPKDEDLREKILKYIEKNRAGGYINMVGRREGTELKAWYYTGQVLVLPSTYEPFGAVVNEALLAGQYVMVSDVAGSACLVTKDNGELIDINRKYIDFDGVSQRIGTVGDTEPERKNMTPCSYREKMDGLVEWLKSL